MTTSLESVQFRRVEELLHTWESRTRRQTAEVSRLAENVVNLDLELCETVEKLESLQSQQAQAELRQREIDAALDQIQRHQMSLLTALQSMENLLQKEQQQAGSSSASVDSSNPSTTHHLPRAVRSLQSILDDGETRIADLIAEVNSLQEALYPGSLGEIMRSLNLQQRSLDKAVDECKQLRERVAQLRS